VKTEGLIKAEEIDGYRGGEDLESLLQFIEAKPKSSMNPDSNGIGNGNGLAPQQAEKGNTNSSKSKRSRRTDQKSKRSRTPSMTTPSQEKSPDTSQSQKTSRASSISATNIAPPNCVENGTFGNGNGLTEIFSDNNAPDSVTTVKNSLIFPNNAVTSLSNNKKSGTLKKPKKQAGWLVDFNNDIGTGKNRVKSKPPSGSKNTGQEAEMKNQKESETPEKSCEIISNNTNEDSSDEAEPISIQGEIIMTPPFDETSDQTEEQFNLEAVETEPSQNNQFNKLSSQKNIEEQDDVCFNYASILKFIKQGNKFYVKGVCLGGLVKEFCRTITKNLLIAHLADLYYKGLDVPSSISLITRGLTPIAITC
jgi:hypothetical protein